MEVNYVVIMFDVRLLVDDHQDGGGEKGIGYDDDGGGHHNARYDVAHYHLVMMSLYSYFTVLIIFWSLSYSGEDCYTMRLGDNDEGV